MQKKQQNILYIHLQPEEKSFIIPYVKTVQQLLTYMELPEETALIVRKNQLLTYDQHLSPGDSILIRKVASRG